MSPNNWFDKFSAVMDQNIKGVQYGVYAVAGVGLVVALRSVRPFLKFGSPRDVPQHFLEKNMKFNGKVVGVSGGQRPVLTVDHYPLVALAPSRRNGLPIQITSVDVTQNGGTWISHILDGSEISFIPLRAESDVLHAIVFHNNKDVGQHLVTIGFATVGVFDFNLSKNLVYARYYKNLLAAERKAEWKGSGLWQDTLPFWAFALMLLTVNSPRSVLKRVVDLRYTMTRGMTSSLPSRCCNVYRS